jgi:hypothetical protein
LGDVGCGWRAGPSGGRLRGRTEGCCVFDLKGLTLAQEISEQGQLLVRVLLEALRSSPAYGAVDLIYQAPGFMCDFDHDAAAVPGAARAASVACALQTVNGGSGRARAEPAGMGERTRAHGAVCVKETEAAQVSAVDAEAHARCFVYQVHSVLEEGDLTRYFGHELFS